MERTQKNKKDYAGAKIYKLQCHSTGLFYIGHTCCPRLSQRLTKHVSGFKAYIKGNSKNYMTSFRVIEGGNYTITLSENYPCESIDAIHSRERKHIETAKSSPYSKPYCVNKVIPTRTRLEYSQDNKEKIREQKKDYRLKNKDKILEYLQENKEKIREQKKDYRLKNKDKIAQYKREYNLKKKHV